MLVYGDRSELADAQQRLSDLARQLGAIAAMAPGIERHAKLVGALIEAGRLQQGVEDQGICEPLLGAFVHRLARSVVESWDSRLGAMNPLPAVPAIDLPQELELKVPEGFAFYAVYPEAYADAARALRLSASPRVIGIRSIGTTLGAVVAAALGAPPPVTVRPFGDPFARQVELPEPILDGHVHYVIVDEGPGLSGSSFGAVADWLEQRGIAPERIAFVPSHRREPGPRASEAHRQRWRRAQRAPAEFDPSWLAERFGDLEPFSTGSAWERRKFLATSNGERVLLKFAGLGRIGESKLAMARALHAAGYTPEPLGLIHGFLIERWCEEARPLAPGDAPVDEIGRYIGARARLFPAEEDSGATIEGLLAMCRRNIELALGVEAARRLDRWQARTAQLARRVVRVRTDNKLHRQEWLRLPGGRLLKTDALDHHQGHDLIGCQDVAWDVAGAIAEFDLDMDQEARLIAATGQRIDCELLAFYRVAYAAFETGQATLAGCSAIALQRRRRHLDHLLHENSATRDSAGIPG